LTITSAGRLTGLALLLLAACTTQSATPAAKPDAQGSDALAQDAPGQDVDAGPSYLQSLQTCWPDLKCPRAFVISHGGDWSLADFPYDSKSAFLRAYAKGADGLKTDVHVTLDGVAVVAHSSPILGFESQDCAGLEIEKATAAQVTACHIFPSETETFQRVDDVLEWARGKLTIMLTVKEDKDFARAIQIVREHHAEDYVFFEARLGDLQGPVALAQDATKVWYNAELSGPEEIDALLATKNPRVLMIELDGFPSEPQVLQAAVGKIHGAGMRAFVSSKDHPSTDEHIALFQAGFDVVMSYNLDHGIEARKSVNTSRGVTPP
jgi:glycerophosphoryl diester phosphodiesterase